MSTIRETVKDILDTLLGRVLIVGIGVGVAPVYALSLIVASLTGTRP